VLTQKGISFRKTAGCNLEQKQKEIEVLFAGLETKINNKAIEKVLLAIALFLLTKPSKEVLNSSVSNTKWQYKSNVKAFVSNSLRRVEEIFRENIFNGLNKRSLATDQLDKISFNKNEFKLSVLAHARGLFRNLLAKASEPKTDLFKCLVSKDVLPTLNPSGITTSVLFLIKSKNDWSKDGGLNISVVDGLGLHHGSQEYYLPIFDLEKEELLAKEQRKVFLES